MPCTFTQFWTVKQDSDRCYSKMTKNGFIFNKAIYRQFRWSALHKVTKEMRFMTLEENKKRLDKPVFVECFHISWSTLFRELSRQDVLWVTFKSCLVSSNCSGPSRNIFWGSFSVNHLDEGSRTSTRRQIAMRTHSMPTLANCIEWK